MTKNFTLAELTYSQTATRKGIDNTPSTDQEANLKELAENILQPVRNYLKEPLRVTSGFRSAKLNKAIGGARKSQHKEGKAADIVCSGRNAEIFRYIKHNLDFDQLIWEAGTDDEPLWIHVSYNGENNRKQSLRMVREGKRVRYYPF